MDVNSINNNISTLNTGPSTQLERTSSSQAVHASDDNSLNLAVKEYNKKRDELSIDVQSLNIGIAASKITQNGLDKQNEFISDIRKALENLKSEDNTLNNKNDIKQEINEKLKDFNQVAYETKFQGENLLNVEYYEEKTSIEISTQNQNFSIEKPHTPNFANEVFDAINQDNLNDVSQLDNSIKITEQTSNQIQNISDKFTEFGNRLETSARESITEQRNLFNENKSNEHKNFGKESSDFTSTNITANSGYLVASQANIVQEQSVRLLS